MKTLISIVLVVASLSGCAWWNSKGKAEATAAVACLESTMASQVSVIIAQLLAGNTGILATVGEDVLACVGAALVQTPSAAAAPGPGVQSRRDVAFAAVRTEIARRKAAKTK